MGMARWWRKSFRGLRMGVVSCALPVLVGALLALSPWAHAQTELTLVTWFEPGSLDPVIEAFEAENPDIRVVVNFVAGPRESFEAVLVRTAGGAPPDLAMVQHGERALAMTSDIFLDLAPYIQRDLQIEEYLPEIVRFWNQNQLVGGPGQIIFPLVAYTGVIYYNEDLFQQAGLLNPKELHARDAWTREAFEEAARRITRRSPDGALETVGFTMIPSWIEGTFIHNAGGRLFDEAATRTLITEQPFVDAVQWLADLIHVNGVAVVDSWDHQWFLTNRAGMMHNAAWMMGMLNETDVRYDLAPLFYTGEHRPHNSPSGDAIAILKDSPNIDAAWRFVRFMVSPEGLRHFTAGVPVHREVAQEYGRGVDRPSNMAAFVYETATKMAVFYPADIPAEATDPIWQATSRVYAGEVPASVALREVAGVVDAVLAEWRAR